MIKDHCNDPRWHEVIRLIIAGLENDESQQYLIEQLLSQRQTDQHVILSSLLGGVLLDGIDSAEIHDSYKGKIIANLLRSSCLATNSEQLSLVISPLRSLLTKKTVGEEAICTELNSLMKNTDIDKEKIVSILVALSVGISQENLVELVSEYFKSGTREAALFEIFFIERPIENISPFLMDNINLLWMIQDNISLSSSGGNFVAAVLQAVVSFLGRNTVTKRAFQEQIATLFSGNSGPFIDFTSNCIKLDFYDLLLTLPENLYSIFTWAIESLDTIARKQLKNNKSRFSSFNSALKPASSVLVQDKQPSSEVPLLERFRKVSAVLRKHTLGIHIDKDANWQTIILEPSIYNAILTILCESFNLEPRLQWKEALRVSFLSKVPQRIRLFYQPVWEQVKDTFESREVDEAEIYSAAWQLIFDSWLYVFEYYSSPEESIFRHLADITGKSDIPALRVAHCIRDIAYGDTSRVNELRSMIESTDPNYQSIFEDSPKLIKSISHSTEFGVQKTIEGDEEHIIIV